MGQQQLLLLVLGIVIVGLAVVVGIQAFSENQEKANVDARINDGVRIASDAQSWALKPTAFGGGNGDFHVGDATTGALADYFELGYSDTDGTTTYNNPNGAYALAASGTGLLITASKAGNTDVFVQICGFETNDITTQVGGTAPTACA
ncbi:MAG: hypothetical protein AAF791_03960 [Bacteroidota bacterium]